MTPIEEETCGCRPLTICAPMTVRSFLILLLTKTARLLSQGWIDWRGPSLVLGGKETTPLNSNIKLVLEPSTSEHEIEDETSCSYLSLLNPYTFFTEPLAGCSGWAVFKFFDM